MKSNLKHLLPIFAALTCSGCATYHVSTESLIEQAANSGQQKKETYFAPFYVPFSVTGNSLKEIKVLDKNEQETVLPVTNHTGVRITKNDGKRKTFYFNTLLIKDSMITGKNDHFIGTNIKPINLNNVKRVEIQR
jgi:hypothetical protein